MPAGSPIQFLKCSIPNLLRLGCSCPRLRQTQPVCRSSTESCTIVGLLHEIHHLLLRFGGLHRKMETSRVVLALCPHYEELICGLGCQTVFSVFSVTTDFDVLSLEMPTVCAFPKVARELILASDLNSRYAEALTSRKVHNPMRRPVASSRAPSGLHSRPTEENSYVTAPGLRDRFTSMSDSTDRSRASFVSRRSGLACQIASSVYRVSRF